MRLRLTVFAAIAACLASRGVQAGEILNIGDPAPALAVSSFVKGEKVEKFEPGKTYVVEFWATWCGPCRASIPHVTELAHRYKDKGVRFIGVDVWERDTKLVKPFLEEMGDKMDYSVALDSVPENGGPNDGEMAKNWMKAAEESGIPSAFIIHDGKIAWIGHPMTMDDPLAKITAGNWDPTAMAKARLVAKTTERKAALVQQKVYTPYRARDYKATLAAIEAATSGDAELAKQFEGIKFASLCNSGEIDAALEMGAKLLDEYKDNPNALNNYFWNVIDPQLPKKPDPRVAALALKAARRSVELTHEENMANLDTLSQALFLNGDFAGAISTEEKALKRLEAEAKDKAHPYFKTFRDRIEGYRKAAEDAKK